MAKKKETTLHSWDDVNKALKDLGEKKIKAENLEGEQTIKINEIKADYDLKGGEIKAEIKSIEENIELFCEANKEEFVKDRTKKMTFGFISYRLTESLAVKNLKATVAAIKKLDLVQYLRIKEEPDKEALKGLDDSTLLRLGVTRKKIDKISIEPNYEELNTCVEV